MAEMRHLRQREKTRSKVSQVKTRTKMQGPTLTKTHHRSPKSPKQTLRVSSRVTRRVERVLEIKSQREVGKTIMVAGTGKKVEV